MLLTTLRRLIGCLALALPSIYSQSFRVMDGITLTSQETLPYKMTSSHCGCLSACRSDGECLAYSASRVADYWKCVFFANGPQKFALKPSPGTKIFVKAPAVGKLESDGLFYYVPPLASSWEDAKTKCEAFPGFRLALLKSTKTKDVAFTYYKALPAGSGYMAIDMFKSDPTTILLGDNTNLDDTDIDVSTVVVSNDDFDVDIFVLARDNIHDERRNQELVPLCQGNFLNIHY